MTVGQNQRVLEREGQNSTKVSASESGIVRDLVQRIWPHESLAAELSLDDKSRAESGESAEQKA